MKNKHFETVSEFLNMSLRSGDEIFDRFAVLPGAISDKGKAPLERYVYIPGTRKDRVVLVAHMDTVWDVAYDREITGDTQPVFGEDGTFRSGNPSCGIGADDRAGCAMLWELRGCGHSILVCDGEEHGKLGARYLKKSNRKLFRELNSHCFMLELDWQGTGGCLYNQVDNTDAFKHYISDILGFKDDKSQGGCDLQVLCGRICGANIGVGYHGYHRAAETLSLSEWESTLHALEKFLAKEQRRFKSKFWPPYIRFARGCAGKILRALKLK